MKTTQQCFNGADHPKVIYCSYLFDYPDRKYYFCKECGARLLELRKNESKFWLSQTAFELVDPKLAPLL